MKKIGRLIKAFGLDEDGVLDLPRKKSGTFVQRLLLGDEQGCSRCFPHGYETVNSHIVNRQRNWKRHRKTRWK